jgi:hypothetical protein
MDADYRKGTQNATRSRNAENNITNITTLRISKQRILETEMPFRVYKKLF